MKEKMASIANLLMEKHTKTFSFKRVDEIDKQFDSTIRQLKRKEILELENLANLKFKKLGDLLYRYDKLLKHNNMIMSAEKQKQIVTKMTVYAEIKSKCKQVGLELDKADKQIL